MGDYSGLITALSREKERIRGENPLLLSAAQAYGTNMPAQGWEIAVQNIAKSLLGGVLQGTGNAQAESEFADYVQGATQPGAANDPKYAALTSQLAILRGERQADLEGDLQKTMATELIRSQFKDPTKYSMLANYVKEGKISEKKLIDILGGEGRTNISVQNFAPDAPLPESQIKEIQKHASIAQDARSVMETFATAVPELMSESIRDGQGNIDTGKWMELVQTRGQSWAFGAETPLGKAETAFNRFADRVVHELSGASVPEQEFARKIASLKGSGAVTPATIPTRMRILADFIQEQKGMAQIKHQTYDALHRRSSPEAKKKAVGQLFDSASATPPPPPGFVPKR